MKYNYILLLKSKLYIFLYIFIFIFILLLICNFFFSSSLANKKKKKKMAPFSRKVYLKLAKGFHRRNKNCPRIMINKVHKALKYAYIARRVKKRFFRRQWVMSINTAVAEHNINYSRFIYG